jgi:hypothetical protein
VRGCPGEQAADLGNERRVRGAVRGVALEQRQHGRQQEREEHAVGLGQVEALPGSVHGEKAEWI